MLIEREAIARVVDVLDPEDFYSPQHQLLYRVMIDLFNESDPVDLSPSRPGCRIATSSRPSAAPPI